MKMKVSKLYPYLILIPSLGILLGVGIYPISYAIYMSLHQYSLIGIKPFMFIGGQNYVELFGEPLFWKSLQVTLLFVFGALVAELVFGLVLALLFRGESRVIGVSRAIITYPMLMAPAIVGMVWRFLYHPIFGPISLILPALNLPQISPGDSSTALLSLVIADVWQWTPLIFLIFLSGILAIPPELYEAAEIDGMPEWHKFRYITMPNLRVFVGMAALLRGTALFSEFDKIFVITRGGPGTSTMNLVYRSYETAFGYYSIGEAAALCIIVLIMVNVFVTAFLRFMGRFR